METPLFQLNQNPVGCDAGAGRGTNGRGGEGEGGNQTHKPKECEWLKDVAKQRGEHTFEGRQAETLVVVAVEETADATQN